MSSTVADGKALLRAVLEEPRDDLHRLAYADWLAERDGPTDGTRAEFIQVQCRLWARDPGRQTGCGLVDGRNPNHGNPDVRRESHLLEQDGHLWLQADLRAAGLQRGGKWLGAEETTALGHRSFATRDALFTPHGRILGVEWARGFVHKALLSKEDFRRHAARLFGLWPLTAVVLTDARPARDGYHQPPRFRWFRRKRRWDNPHSVGPSACDVPPEVWPYLPDRGPGTAGFASEDEALEALSRACVAYGRAQAGFGAGPRTTSTTRPSAS